MFSPRKVFDDPATYSNFLTESSDDKFEGQQFDRKEAGRPSNDAKQLARHLQEIRDEIKETISAFANANEEGGLLVLGIASDGSVYGINHLSEQQKNSLLDFATLLHHQAAEAKMHQLKDASGDDKTICLILVPAADGGICETPGPTPKAWIRRGAQNVPITQDVRDRIRTTKGFLGFERTACCRFHPEDIDGDVLKEFRKVFHPESTGNFTVERLLFEAGAIVEHNEEYWFTNAGLLFFGANPQRVLPRSYIRLLRFEVSSNQFNNRGLPTHDQSFKGSLTKQIRAARTFFRESAFFKRYQKRNPEGGFVDEPEFPPTVIDEAIVNAVTHRDYRTGLPIECESYTDAFIVKNPGRMLQNNRDLPNNFSLADTELSSMSRNQKLLEWLKDMKDPSGTAYVQAISEGTKQMLQAMTTLKLPAPWYRLAENETLLKLENKAEEREAAILAASQVKSTEFSNLFPLRIRQGDKVVGHKAFGIRYSEFIKSFRDVLEGNGWYIDRFGFSRIVAHRRGVQLDIPSNVKPFLRMYSAYEFQIRRYFENFYLCVDYKCQVHNVQKLSAVGQQLPRAELINSRCFTSNPYSREGRIINFDSEFALVHFFDTESDENVPIDSVIPSCSLTMLDKLLQQSGIPFNLSMAIKRYSLASKAGLARERSDKIARIVEYIASSLFPVQFGDFEVNITTEPVKLIEQGNVLQDSFPVHRLPEPTVEFREHRSTSDVREGITRYGTYDSGHHSIELIPICVNSMRHKMQELIDRLKYGKYKYRGAERTYSTKFSNSTVITVNNVEDTRAEIERILVEHSDWRGDISMKRLFLVHAPEQGYAKDNHASPYYTVKRLLLEQGIPCQMVDTQTLQNADFKDLNLALNIVAKCGVKPWVLPDAIPDADFFIGLSYTQSSDGQRIMGFASVFNSYGRWEFYSGNTSYFDFEERTHHLAQLVKTTLLKLKNQLSPTPKIAFHYSARISHDDRVSILKAARTVIPEGTFNFVWINSHHNVRFYDNRPETDGSLRRGSYVEAATNRIFLSTTGYNSFRRALGTPKPLEVAVWPRSPERVASLSPDLRALAVQVLSLTKLNWASTDSFCGQPITLKYAGDIAYLTAAFLRQSEPFKLHPALEKTPWFI